MDADTITRPARSPSRPRRRLRRPAPRPHIARSQDDVARHDARTVEQATRLMDAGSGSFGRGPSDGDGDGRRRPDRDGGDAKRLLVALGLIAVGAGVMSARLLSQAGRRRRFS